MYMISSCKALRSTLGSFVVGLLLLANVAGAQTPLYLADDIPLDKEEIFQVLEPSSEYAATTRNIISQLIRNHYSEIVLDDEFSSDMLDRYIEMLDPLT